MVAALAALVLAGGSVHERLSRPQGPGALFLWAWERPEDLAFLASEERVSGRTGVAHLAGTLRISGTAVHARPRLNPIVLPADIRWIPVVRVESDAERPPALDRAQADAVARALETLYRDWPAAEVQIDFDARVSERDFYRRVLERLRALLPAGTRISITALASWCLGDPWIADLPVDDAVPMLFRMGHDAAAVRRALAAGEDFRLAICRSSLGISTDEPIARLPAGRRTFLFHPTSWDERAYREAIGAWTR